MLQKHLIISMLVVFLTSVSFAQKGSNGYIHGKRIWSDLKLTTEQKNDLKALHEQSITARKNHRDEIRLIRQKIVEELQKGNSSKTLLDQYAQDLGSLNVKLNMNRNEHLLKVKGILTTEQFNMMLKDHDEDKGKQSYGHKNGNSGCIQKGELNSIE